MRQQLVDATGGVRRQAIQHVLEVGVWVMPVDACRVQQTHDGGRSLARPQAAGEQPIRSADRDRADLVLDPIVRDRHVAVAHEVRELLPALQAVVDGLDGGRAGRHQLSLPQQPSVEHGEDPA